MLCVNSAHLTAQAVPPQKNYKDPSVFKEEFDRALSYISSLQGNSGNPQIEKIIDNARNLFIDASDIIEGRSQTQGQPAQAQGQPAQNAGLEPGAGYIPQQQQNAYSTPMQPKPSQSMQAAPGYEMVTDPMTGFRGPKRRY